MKSKLITLFTFAVLCLNAQTNYYGGSNDGAAHSALLRALPLSLYNGGNADGFAWSNGQSPAAINIYNGGLNDGHAHGVLAANSFNIFNGGANDGYSTSGLAPLVAFNMYAGGSNDGFAWHNGISPATINLFTGGSNDGYANSSLLPVTAFNVYAGGNNDGFGSNRLIPTAAAFNPYRGGTNDGFAYYSSAQPTVSVCDNPIIIQQTLVSNITKRSATFQWVTFNPGSTTSYNIVLRSGGVSGTVIRIYSDLSLTDTNTLNIINLTPGVYYCLTIQEHCQPGISTDVSNSACFTTYPDDCPPPTVLQHLGNTGSSVTLGWQPGVSTSGVTNYGYEIQLTPQGTSNASMYAGNISGTPVNRTITCLPASTIFTYQVREQCAVNKYSDWVNGYSTYTSTGCTAPANLTGSMVNAQNANLSWESLYANETDKPYQVSYGQGITSPDQGALTPVTTITPGQVSGNIRTHNLFVSSGVSNLTCYVREVCSLCDTTLWTGPYTLPATCTAPVTGNMTVTNLTSTSATLNWVSPNLNSAALVQLINYSSNTSVYYNYTASNIYTRMQALTGLVANTNYGWRVKEYCSANDSTAFSNWQNFTTPAGAGACSAPTNQGIFVTFGSVLIAKWDCPFYPDTLRGYQVAAGMNIASPAQATIVQGSKYFRTQSPTNPTHFFSAGNTPGFTWYVRDICAPGDTSAWLGPYVMGAAKTDGGEFTTGVADKEEEQLMLQLFPNPNSGNPLIVKTAALGNSATLAIYNLQGDLVANHPLKPDGLTTIDVSALSNAVYLCRVTSPATVKTIRLVIQR